MKIDEKTLKNVADNLAADRLEKTKLGKEESLQFLKDFVCAADRDNTLDLLQILYNVTDDIERIRDMERADETISNYINHVLKEQRKEDDEH